MNNRLDIPVEDHIDEDGDLIRYLDIVISNRWLIISIFVAVTLLGTAYAFLARPTYEADMMIQVEEDNPTSASTLLGDVSSLFDVKTQAEGELEILQSQFVVDQAVQNLRLYIDAQPRYFPLVGWLIAANAKTLSNPGLLGWGGFAWGTESIDVREFDVPKELYDERFKLTLLDNHRFILKQSDLDSPIEGVIGQAVDVEQSVGHIHLLVRDVHAKPGATFVLKRQSKLKTLTDLQDKLNMQQKGKQSDIITGSLRGTDPQLISSIMNQIGQAYVEQNVKRKAAEADQSSHYLETLLPGLKHDLEVAEKRYTTMRNQRGSFDVNLEAQTFLQQSVATQSGLLDLEQKRADLASRYAPGHPAIAALDQQIDEMKSKLGDVNGHLKRLPNVDQDAVSLMRDVQVAQDIYVGTLNEIQQLKLVSAGKVGNVRLVDPARLPDEPVWPKKPLVIGLAAIAGLIFGIGAAFAREMLYGGVTDAQDIERYAGLNVYGTIPLSQAQKPLNASMQAGKQGKYLLAETNSTDPSIESLRSLRTALSFAMLEAPNNRLLLTGPAPGVGKSFISANLAAVLCGGGKRVLLVDADMRRGHLHQYFGRKRGTGLSNVLAGQATAEAAIQYDVSQGLDLMTTGSIPPNASELLLSESMSRLMESLSERYDMVVIDTPPVLAVSDAPVMATIAGTVFLVSRFQKTTIGELTESARQLQRSNAPLRGVIFNGVDARAFGYRSKYGSYRYVAYQYQNQKPAK
ncbi:MULTISPECIES: polysaccharide biosynthesis tyrosine autokinase [Burkholderiaceae]|uniref:polysaccharide biosynthesis tyrosine autokinase n=1 Tax=Burkholderiaceae TaxID=119060 RepID=UPI0014241693|nr:MULTISPECIES: polysaccharide biosynthesis tyrosine autokinase [Burkholderiaceae]MBN3847584.1 polysaccharide biosynthesis tyrosine autokinase [Paraburkholderia sp. Ac-20342]NIF53328.1 polysaccharide biosynthesis tyrosine autokinase [Burkholderia sp. Ax-1724]